MKILLFALLLLVWFAPGQTVACHEPTNTCMDTSLVPENAAKVWQMHGLDIAAHVMGRCNNVPTPGVSAPQAEAFVEWYIKGEPGKEAKIHIHNDPTNEIAWQFKDANLHYSEPARAVATNEQRFNLLDTSTGKTTVDVPIRFKIDDHEEKTATLTLVMAACEMDEFQAIQDISDPVDPGTPPPVPKPNSFKQYIVPVGAGILVGIAATVIFSRNRQ